MKNVGQRSARQREWPERGCALQRPVGPTAIGGRFIQSGADRVFAVSRLGWLLQFNQRDRGLCQAVELVFSHGELLQ